MAAVSFRAVASLAHCDGSFTYDWDFGDGSPHNATNQVCHSYPNAGDYTWKLTVQANGLTQVVNGIVTISPQLGPPVVLTITQSNGVLTVSWPADRIGTSLETTPDPTTHGSWTPVDGLPAINGATAIYQTPMTPDPQYFRVRRVP
jgi:PKD repeat protein